MVRASKQADRYFFSFHHSCSTRKRDSLCKLCVIPAEEAMRVAKLDYLLSLDKRFNYRDGKSRGNGRKNKKITVENLDSLLEKYNPKLYAKP